MKSYWLTREHCRSWSMQSDHGLNQSQRQTYEPVTKANIWTGHKGKHLNWSHGKHLNQSQRQRWCQCQMINTEVLSARMCTAFKKKGEKEIFTYIFTNIINSKYFKHTSSFLHLCIFIGFSSSSSRALHLVLSLKSSLWMWYTSRLNAKYTS